jgi:signal transduction histidine kinase
MGRAIRTFWNEPAAPDPPPPGRRDWALTGFLIVAALVEAALRSVVWKPVNLLFVVAVALALPWRRTHPFAVAGSAFMAFGFLSVASGILDAPTDDGFYTGAFMLILPYTLLRWGSGRAAILGFPMMVALPWTSLLGGNANLGEAIGGTVFFLFPAEFGAAVRYWHSSRERAIGQARLHERELLARELHDTVAHHVSAISIQAQAGRTVAATDPDAAIRALDAIEEASSRTLVEMRTMVGVLRKGERADRSPQPGVADIARLTRSSDGPPAVKVELSGVLDDLRPSVDAAVYRLAQESITNARRHARNASNVLVTVVGTDDSVELTVVDDGEVSSANTDSSQGFGLAGMTERASLLGGTLDAGPVPGGGWKVEGVVPKEGDVV